MKSLEKSPEKRFQTAKEMAEALKSLHISEPHVVKRKRKQINLTILIVFIIIICIGIFGVIVINTNIKSSVDYYKTGLEFYGKKNYDQAIKNFNKALEINLKNHNAFYYRAKIWQKKRKTDKALVDYSRNGGQCNPNSTRPLIH